VQLNNLNAPVLNVLKTMYAGFIWLKIGTVDTIL